MQESHNCGTQHKSTFIVHINNHDATISINYNPVIIIMLYVKWVESVGVSKGVWFVPTFLFEKLATMGHIWDNHSNDNNQDHSKR